MTIRAVSSEDRNPYLSPLLTRSDDYNVSRFMETTDVELVDQVLAQVISLDQDAVGGALHSALANFGTRHYQLRALWGTPRGPID